MSSPRAAIATPAADALMTGGLSILGMGAILVALLVFGARVGFVDGDWIAITILVNSTHFMASYRLLYVSKSEVLANRWSAIYVPVLLVGIYLFAAFGTERARTFDVLVFLSSIYLAWHYTGQAWGMVATFGHIVGIRFASWERLCIRAGMRALLALHVLFALSGRLPPSAWIAPARYVALYNGLFGLVCAGAALGLVAGALAYGSAHRRHGRLPIRCVLPWLALFFWYPFWYFVPGGFLWVQLSHALQYLPFPLRVDANRYAAAAPRTPLEQRRRALLGYLGLVVAGAAILNGAPLAAHLFGEGWYSSPDARVLFIAFTNCVAIHHYFIDGAVWKLRNEKVRQELFRHLEARTA